MGDELASLTEVAVSGDPKHDPTDMRRTIEPLPPGFLAQGVDRPTTAAPASSDGVLNVPVGSAQNTRPIIPAEMGIKVRAIGASVSSLSTLALGSGPSVGDVTPRR